VVRLHLPGEDAFVVDRRRLDAGLLSDTFLGRSRPILSRA